MGIKRIIKKKAPKKKAAKKKAPKKKSPEDYGPFKRKGLGMGPKMPGKA